MKKFAINLLMLTLAVVLLPIQAMGQQPMQVPTLPVDQDVRIGKLPNGLTYYIRHNEQPKGQADFYIAQKVGSIQEEDNQRGLAHFLEHMCFNGTTHYPDSLLLTWLETIGVKFGQNLNAYTSIDETVYNIAAVPVVRESIIDSCLLILHDWANDLTLDPKEIDKERGVIHEEWRRSNNGQFRVMTEVLPSLYPTTKYGHRMPIGTMEVVDNFAPQTLRDYYETWYRPDLQGVVVVGDIDVDQIEKKIIALFSDIEMPENAPAREYLPVPDHEGTLYGIGKDKEMRNDIVQLMILSDPIPQEYVNTAVYYQQHYIMDMITAMLNNRFKEISMKPDAPFATAFANFGGYLLSSRTKDAFTVGFIPKDGDIEGGYEAMYRELLRATKGFAQSEYDRVKADYMSGIETAYNNRNSRENETFVHEYVRNFLDGDPIPGIEVDYEIAQQLSQMLPLEVLNQVMASVVTPDNRAIMAFLIDREGVETPTPETFAAITAKVDAEDIEAHVDNFRTDPLIAKLPKKGKIAKEYKDELWNATVWELSNGAKVVMMPTKFKDDQILFKAVAKSGTQNLPAKYDNALIFDDMFEGMGLGTYNSHDLSRYLSGKQVALSPAYGNNTREMNGSTTPKDMASLMELIYMMYTAPYVDAEEFEATRQMIINVLKNQETQPEFVFNKMMMNNLYKSPRQRMISTEIISQVNPQDYVEVSKAMTDNAADWTFVFVGNLDEAAMRPLVEQYIASIPGNAKKAVRDYETFNSDMFVTPGDQTVCETMEMSIPQTYLAVSRVAEMPYDGKTSIAASIAGQVLTKRLLKTVREDMGATYSCGASASARRVGPMNVNLSSAFPLKPEMKNEVIDVINTEIKNMESDITEDEVNAIREFMIKSYKEGLEKNEAILGNYVATQWNGVDVYHQQLDILNNITPADVMNFMRNLNANASEKIATLDPKAE